MLILTVISRKVNQRVNREIKVVSVVAVIFRGNKDLVMLDNTLSESILNTFRRNND